MTETSKASTDRLLAIDAGNTSVAIGVFDGDELISTFRVASNRDRFTDEWTIYVDGLLRSRGVDPSSITCAAVSSTVPALREIFENICEGHYSVPLLVVDASVDHGVNIRYENEHEIGPDRILHAVAGLAKYAPPLVIVDLGTACVFDAIDADGYYLGGAISPGIGLASSALFEKAALLRSVELKAPANSIGTNTEHALQSGICLGYGALVDGMVSRFKSEMSGNVTVIGTGGYIDLVRGTVSCFDVFEEDLNLRGLQILSKRAR